MKFRSSFLRLWVIFALLDPDPDSEYGSTDLIESGSNRDPDPQHCILQICSFTSGFRIRIRIRIRINLSCWIRIRIQIADPDPDPGGQNDPKIRKKDRIFIFWSAGCSLLRAEGFSCSLGVLYGGLGIIKLQFLIKKIKIKFLVVNFFQF